MRTALVRSLVTAFVIAVPVAAQVEPGSCGQPFSAGADPATSDALFVLRASVGLEDCDLCLCDLNGNGTVAANDALIDLRLVVGQSGPTNCPPCTTTTLACPAAGGLDKLVFQEKYDCVESGSCVDDDETDSIRFDHKGGGSYEVRDFPDTGFVYTGILSCTTFEWMADGGDYTESGTWEFNTALTSFRGTSSYEAKDESYSGDCEATGAKSPL
jgi:hypothetical protein